MIKMVEEKNFDKKSPDKKPFRPPVAEKKVDVKLGDNYRHIVRISNTDLKGEKKLHMALHKIKGISFMLSNFVCYSAKVDPDKITGIITEQEIEGIEDVIKNPAKYNCPAWLMNRRKEYVTGQDMHLITTNLDLTVDNDLKRMKKLKTYKGLRHMWGQPVRGQRTKSNFRKNKGKVSLGVIRNKAAVSGGAAKK
jgi:small subunit ribosomal protein S13